MSDEEFKLSEPVPFSLEQEKVEIDRLSTKERNSRILRWSVLALLIAAGVAAYLKVTLKPGTKFSLLDTVAYESIRLEEDDDTSRLNFPNDDLSEIKDYLNKALPDSYANFSQIPPPWQALGASVYDYDVAAVSVVQIENVNTKAKIYLYAKKGELSELPKANVHTTRKNKVVHTFGNQQFNILAWAKTDKVIVLVGKSDLATLSNFADLVD